MHWASSLPIGFVLVVVSAFTNALAFPPWSVRPLALVSLVPLFVALRTGSHWRMVCFALLWAEISAWTIASAFPSSMASFYGRSAIFGVVIGSLIFFVTAAVYYVGFAAVDRVMLRSRALRGSILLPLLTAAAWVTAELGRGRLFTGSDFFIGNPWGLQGYTHASGVFGQIASVTGVYGISFALVAVNAGVAGLLMAGPDRAARQRASRALAVSALPALAFSLFGVLTLREAPELGRVEGAREIAVVQGNVSIDRRWRSDYYGKNLDVYLGLTRRALDRGAPGLIIWPETSLNFFLEAEPRLRGAIEETLRGGGAELLVGGPSGEGDKRPPYFNSVFLLGPEAGVTARYDKEYLVPFSEYLPALGPDWMARRTEGARTFEPGVADPGPLETSVGRVGVLICNEAMLPEVAGARVRRGAEILVSPSNDSWIRGRAFAEHMLAVVGLRAIEQRRDVVRASTAGPSAVVDRWGRVVARTEVGSSEVLRSHVRPAKGLTLYARVGDAFAVSCVSAVVAALVWLGRRGRVDRGEA